MNSNRDNSIDIMRAMGLLLIILAHVNPPYQIHELRAFDVPLMLFVSGLAYGGKKIGMTYSRFLSTRVKRLIIPTYLFLIIYFVCHSIMAKLDLAQPIPFETIANSFVFRYHPAGIGYIWIIRVFLIVTIVMPAIIWLNGHIRHESFACAIIILLLVIQELLVYFLNGKNLSWFIEEWLLCLIGYSTMFLLGYRIRQLKTNVIAIYLIVVLSTFCLVALSLRIKDETSFNLLSFNDYKYPPQMYYILYGMLACLLIWISRSIWGHILNNKLITFIGQNTLWLYFWHILLLKPVMLIIEDIWAIQYIIILSLSLLGFFIQFSIVSNIKSRTSSDFIRNTMDYLVG